MYLLIIFLPFLSFLICGIFGRNLGHLGTKLISNILLFISVILSLLIFINIVLDNDNLYFNLWNWFNIGLLSNNIGMQFDIVVSSMLLLVMIVSFFVHLFSSSYMSEDPHIPRFMSYLSLFTFFMVILITSNNLIQLFIGWEGVGLCSYLLINFWFTRIQANKASIKAMLVNKIGDIGLLLGIILLWFHFGTLDYSCIFSSLSICQNTNLILNWITFLFLISVIGKSAQLGLHTWLPDAMEGPTPVSALIHAATMVTAGVFLIIRVSPLFENTPLILILVILIGSLTAFFASTIGLTQNDLKKVIAYSTCSQLGYMVMICGFSQYSTGLFHLVNHGFFKALLFLSAGSIIHSLNNEQDIRRMGSLKFIMPLSYISVFIGSISLMGLPFLTGYYSKDLILELIYFEHFFSFALWLGLIATFITSFYSFRLIYYTFLGSPQGNLRNFQFSHEGKWNLFYPLLGLLILSIIIGYFLQFILLKDEVPIIIPNFNKFLPFLFSIIGASLSLYLGYKIFLWWRIGLKNIFIIFFSFTNNAWHFNQIIHNYLVNPIIKFGFNITYKLIDNQLLEVLGPLGIVEKLKKQSNFITYFHLGKVSTYIFMFIIFVICVIIKL